MRGRRAGLVAFAAASIGGCGDEPVDKEVGSMPREPADVLWSTDTLSPSEIELGRRDSSWRQAVKLDRRFVVRAALDTVAIPEIWDDIGEEPALADPPGREEGVHLPLYGDVEGPSVLYVQVLLDRARFSPGILDGKWGKNTEKAVYWLQHREELPATGLVDSTTYARIFDLAGRPERFDREHVLTEDDVTGLFRRIPRSVYAQARLKCLCYETLTERLAER
ncbi:MAG: peptidoglycan-binding protein, partial [Gemmatimonadetes bacterium]|nr:peptidoglycan-binding protein [Gemmatimonadota bacterium]